MYGLISPKVNIYIHLFDLADCGISMCIYIQNGSKLEMSTKCAK